ncbi:MAG: DUF5947 family protein [Acidobacteriaceae bacterium]
MHATETTGDGLAALRRFTRAQPKLERCELCGTALGPEHPHLLERTSRRVSCACTACALLFCGQENSRYRRVPGRVVRLRDFAFSDAEWDEMALPIGLAFFVRGEEGEVVALYPSPAGVVESSIALQSCAERLARDPVARAMEPEVEALLVNRIGQEHAYFVVPVDVCYQLAGLIRTSWRGLSGGPEVWAAVARFFGELRVRAGDHA